jgi:hypothetical protein
VKLLRIADAVEVAVIPAQDRNPALLPLPSQFSAPWRLCERVFFASFVRGAPAAPGGMKSPRHRQAQTFFRRTAQPLPTPLQTLPTFHRD